MQKYQIDFKIGGGGYGKVYHCHNKVTGQTYAMKKIRLEAEEGGISASTLREISILKGVQRAKHENIIEIQEILCEHGIYFLIFELLSMDLAQYLRSLARDEYLSPELLQSYTHQLLSGVMHCHSCGVMHRDLKPQNLFVQDGMLKIGDFGLARAYTPPLRTFTQETVTLWYRAPEIILGTRYSPAIDLWSVGCIFWEMIEKDPLFCGDSAIGELYLIFELLGTPSESLWPGVNQCRYWLNCFPSWPRRRITHRLQDDPVVSDLLSSLLVLNPAHRLTAPEALAHPFFTSAPTFN